MSWSAVLAAGFPVLLALTAVAVVRRRFVVVTVRGISMHPTLAPGDRLVLDRRRAATAARGDIVGVVTGGERRDPGPARRQVYVKRVAAVAGDPLPPGVPPPPGGAAPAGADPGSPPAGTGTGGGAGERPAVPDGMLVVLGDGRFSLDSTTWGCVPRTGVLGVAIRFRTADSRRWRSLQPATGRP